MELPAVTHRNLRAFLLFRIFFNCRFYYPIFMILFLDFGLSMEQFAMLNAAWAISISLLEVPSGALADQFGRRTLVRFAAILMVLEMVVLCVTPIGAGAIVFWLFLVNRIISGAAEAAASGADEALAYDSIPKEHREQVWASVSSKLMLWQSVGFFIATVLGALIYDPSIVNGAAGWLGMDLQLTKAHALKLPLILNVLTAIITLVVAGRLVEIEDTPANNHEAASSSILGSFRRILSAGLWIIKTPAPFLLILLGVSLDGFIRVFYSVASNFYRLIQIPDRWLGFIGAFGSLLGIAAAWVVGRLYAKTKADSQFVLVGLLIALGLAGLSFPIPYYSVLAMIPLSIGMRFLHYFLSNHLNKVTDSSHRATVLSFKGLALNLNYGFMILLFGWQTRFLFNAKETMDGAPTQDQVFAEALTWWLPAFAIASVFLVAIVLWRARGSMSALLLQRSHQDRK